jgi:hypothetical protein
MTKTTVTAALVAILLSGPALSEDASGQTRSKLLAVPVWAYEEAQAPDNTDAHGRPGKVERGKAWFKEKGGKLIGYIDTGLKCDSEVTLRADGFDMETCSAGDKQFLRSGDAYKAVFGSYTYTIRPGP